VMLTVPLHHIRCLTTTVLKNLTLTYCIGFVWQGFGSWGAAGVASVRSCQKLLPCPTEPMPDGSKMGPSLAKAEPISDGGSASGIT